MTAGRRVHGRALAAVLMSVALVVGAAQASGAAEDEESGSTGTAVEQPAGARMLVPGDSASLDARLAPPLAPARSSRDGLHVADVGSLSGSVEAEGVGPVPGAVVRAYRLSDENNYEPVAEAVTDGAGAFLLQELPVGSYDLFFMPPSPGYEYTAAAWLGGGPIPQLPAPLTIEAGENTLPSTHVMPSGSASVGIVKSESGLKPIDGATVTLYASNGPADDGLLYFWQIDQASTLSGTYGFSNLPRGYYVFQFGAPSPKYAGEWWRNKSSFSTADILLFDTPGITHEVNANLRSKVDLGTVAVTGASATGSTLKATHRTSSGTTYKYGWFADGAYISGASKSTFVPTAAQQHKRITVKVTGSKTGVVTTTKSSQPRAKTLLTAVPTISGTTAITNAIGPDTFFWKGSSLTAKPGTWTSGTTLTYQWYSDGKAISGATGSKYTLKPADKWKRISVRVTGSKADYGTFGRLSAQTAKIATLGRPYIGPDPVDTSATPRLRPFFWTHTNGQYAPGTSFTFHYYANGALVESSSSEGLGGLERFVGKRIQVRVVVSNPGFATYTLWTNESNPVSP